MIKAFHIRARRVILKPNEGQAIASNPIIAPEPSGKVSTQPIFIKSSLRQLNVSKSNLARDGVEFPDVPDVAGGLK